MISQVLSITVSSGSNYLVDYTMFETPSSPNYGSESHFSAEQALGLNTHLTENIYHHNSQTVD